MEKFKSLKPVTWYFILPIIVFILFRNGIEIFLAKFLINPVLSHVYPAELSFDIGVLLLFGIATIWIGIKVINGAKMPASICFLGLTYILSYSYYRFYSSYFEFTSISFSKSVKLLDIIALIPTMGIISRVYSRNPKLIQSESEGFSVDEPIDISEDGDLLYRLKFVKRIANKIRNTSTKNGSFPIGIVAPWGAGKTTLLNKLTKQFENDNNYIVVELNVWKCNNSAQIIEMLFKTLKTKLSAFSFTINNKLNDYTSDLLKGTKIDELNGLKNLTQLLFPNPSLEAQYENINNEIKRIGKKLIIVIDDLDRLDKKEIYEVIRLIRNTANFANTFFIVTYDRNYILNALEDINPYRSQYFLEKIFQVEFTLPAISANLLQEEITKRLKQFISEMDFKGYAAILDRDFNLIEYGDCNLTSLFVHNLRDVTRFINSLKLSYDFVENEVYFPDLYNLQLIKYKHPEVFSEVYRKRIDFFTTEGKNDILSNTYSLARTENVQEEMAIKQILGDVQLSILYQHLSKNKDNFKLSDNEIIEIYKAFSSIFSDRKISYYNHDKKVNLSHLRVFKPSMFDRYFTLGIEGKLSHVLFSKIREKNSSDMNSAIYELCKNPDYINDIAEIFEQIQTFDDKEDFKKIVNAIFSFANILKPISQQFHGRNFVGYNKRRLAELIVDDNNINLFSSRNDYKEFISTHLHTDSATWCYNNDFLNSLYRDYFYLTDELFNDNEVEEIMLSNFKNAISKSEEGVTLDLWWNFWRCTFVEKIAQSNGYSRNYKIQTDAIVLMKDFVLANNIDSFLGFCIMKLNRYDTFTINLEALTTIFDKPEFFIDVLRNYQLKTVYREEFITLFETIGNNKQGVSRDFFKVIPIEKYI